MISPAGVPILWQCWMIQADLPPTACGNPLLHDLPVVFSGVNYPKSPTVERYPNVTGYADAPDYLNTVRMLERVMGKSRV